MPMMECTDLRIGAAAVNLHYLRHRGIPNPDDWTYKPYTITRQTGTGEVKGYGYPTATWTWERLDQASIGVLLDFFAADTDASVLLYISTYTDTGRKRTVSDFSCYMQRPVDGDGRAMYPGSVGQVSQDVTLTFTHLEAA